MALQEMNFSFKCSTDGKSIKKPWSHTGVVGSGDMEVLMKQKKQEGKVTVKITTPVKGFDDIWKAIVEKFVEDSSLKDVEVEINDNNSTPFIVSLRLKQALLEAREV